MSTKIKFAIDKIAHKAIYHVDNSNVKRSTTEALDLATTSKKMGEGWLNVYSSVEQRNIYEEHYVRSRLYRRPSIKSPSPTMKIKDMGRVEEMIEEYKVELA